MKQALWVVLVLALTLTACSAQTKTEATVLPLAEIPGGLEGPNVLDNMGTSVVIEFRSGVPTVCNVAYGVDTNYGYLATMSMMGGALRDHSVVLTGLTPNTTYHYRVTLTDEQARVYQSQDLTFTTVESEPSTPSERPKGENVASLAEGAKVSGVSSNWGGGDNDGAFGANKAIDGQPNTAWSSDGDGDNAWIEIQLAQTYDVSAIGFWTRTMGNGTAQIFRFTVTTDQGEAFGPFDLPDADRIYYVPVQFTAHTLRFDAVETNTGNTGAVEIEVFGTVHGR